MDKLLLDDKQVQDEILDIVQVFRISIELLNMLFYLRYIIELWKVLGNVNFFPQHFVFQKIHFVQEQNGRDFGKSSVIDYGVENIPRFFQTIDPFVFKQFLVKLGT